jgi:4,5-DOPA dioxygenase extradiol
LVACLRKLRAFGEATPRPRAIEDDSRVLRFPHDLFGIEYPAPGDPPLAEEIADLVKPTLLGLDSESGAN